MNCQECRNAKTLTWLGLCVYCTLRELHKAKKQREQLGLEAG